MYYSWLDQGVLKNSMGFFTRSGPWGFYMDGKHSLTDENRILYNRKHLFYEKGAERLYAPLGRMDSYLTSHAG